MIAERQKQKQELVYILEALLPVISNLNMLDKKSELMDLLLDIKFILRSGEISGKTAQDLLACSFQANSYLHMLDEPKSLFAKKLISHEKFGEYVESFRTLYKTGLFSFTQKAHSFAVEGLELNATRDVGKSIS